MKKIFVKYADQKVHIENSHARISSEIKTQLEKATRKWLDVCWKNRPRAKTQINRPRFGSYGKKYWKKNRKCLRMHKNLIISGQNVARSTTDRLRATLIKRSSALSRAYTHTHATPLRSKFTMTIILRASISATFHPLRSKKIWNNLAIQAATTLRRFCQKPTLTH